MADQAADQQHKRSRKDKSTDESADSSCGEENTRKRNTRKGLTGAGLFLDLEELDMTPFDRVAFDKSDIEEQLRSGSSILMLERTPINRGRCQALSCLKRELTGTPIIRCTYRLNLIDLTGRRFRKSQSLDLSIKNPNQRLEPDRYYHVTCIEHILDLTALLEQNQIKMKGGISISIGRATITTPRLHLMIEDWFANSGQSADVEEYGRWVKAYNDWKGECTARNLKHRLGIFRGVECTCDPIPKEPAESDYFSAKRTPRLLSEVLASVLNMRRIELSTPSTSRPPTKRVIG